MYQHHTMIKNSIKSENNFYLETRSTHHTLTHPHTKCEIKSKSNLQTTHESFESFKTAAKINRDPEIWQH